MMKSIMTKLIAFVYVLLILNSCGSSNDEIKNPTENKGIGNDPAKQNSTNTSDSALKAKSSITYNFMDKIPGLYERHSDGPDYIQKKVVIKISGKKIIIDGEKYSYDVAYEKNDTLIQVSKVSEDSGDFLGGGTILINGNKIQYKMLFGSEANEEYIFEKKNQ